MEKIKQPKTLIYRNEEFYVSKEIKENALASEGESSIMPTRNNNLTQKINMPVTTSQHETGGKKHIVCTVKM